MRLDEQQRAELAKLQEHRLLVAVITSRIADYQNRLMKAGDAEQFRVLQGKAQEATELLELIRPVVTELPQRSARR